MTKTAAKLYQHGNSAIDEVPPTSCPSLVHTVLSGTLVYDPRGSLFHVMNPCCVPCHGAKKRSFSGQERGAYVSGCNWQPIDFLPPSFCNLRGPAIVIPAKTGLSHAHQATLGLTTRRWGPEANSRIPLLYATTCSPIVPGLGGLFYLYLLSTY